MRIVQLTADGRPGGGTALMLDLSLSLKELGHEVIVISDIDSYAVHTANAAGLQTIEIPFFRSRFDRAGKAKLVRALTQLSPDLVHSHGSRSSFFALGYLKGNHAPFIHTVHGFHFHRKPAPIRRLAILAEKKIAAMSDKIIFVCEQDRILAEQIGILNSKLKGITIYNGVKLSDIPSAVLPKDRTVIFLGRLVPQKNPEMIIALSQKFSREGYTVKIVGGGEAETEVRAQLSGDSKITITGSVTKAEAWEHLRCSSVMVLPSLWEGLPISILEAMAMGVPVVASKVNGIPEMIDGTNGALCDPADSNCFVKSVLMMEDEEVRSRIVSAAKKTVLERFSWETTLNRHLELYQDELRCHSQ